MSEDDAGKDELVRDALNVSGVRQDFHTYTADTWSGRDDKAREPETEPEIRYRVDDRPFPSDMTFLSLPPNMSHADIGKVRAFIAALAIRPKVEPKPPEEPEPETDLQRRERLFRSSIMQYAQDELLFACQACSMRDSAGRPMPTSPHETKLLMDESKRLMERLRENTKDLGYSTEELYVAVDEAIKEVSTSIVQQGKPYAPDESKAIQMLYMNHRGETSLRRVIPQGIYWGATEFHPQEQHLMDVWDLDKSAVRTFALAGFPGIIVPESSSARTTDGGEDGVDG